MLYPYIVVYMGLMEGAFDFEQLGCFVCLPFYCPDPDF